MNYPKRVIQAGEKNARIVKAVQAKLNEAGCGPLEGTGNFGPKTVTAVKLFQSTHRDQRGNPLEIDGKIGAITWAALFGLWKVPTIEDSSSTLRAQALRVAASKNVPVIFTHHTRYEDYTHYVPFNSTTLREKESFAF